MTSYSRLVLLSQPSRIVSGEGSSLTCIGDLAAWEVQRVLVVTSPRAALAGEPLFAALRAQGIQVQIFAEVRSETSFAHFEAAMAVARELKPDCVLGLGGGSALDLAKIVAALHDGTQSLHEVLGINLLASRRTHLVCIPTTAGTGSEVSPNALLLDPEHRKKAVISPWLVPDAAYVDATLMVDVPADVTAYTGIDALTHCLEAYTNRFAHPLVDVYALEGIRLIAGNLLAAVRNGRNLEARSRVALGSLFGGLCLGPVNTAAVHALAYPLGGEFRIPHGLSNALLLTHVMRFNAQTAPDRYAVISRSLEIPPGKSNLKTALRGIDCLEELCRECGIPRHLQDFGIPASAIPRLAAEALQVQRLLKNNPREVTLADAEMIYRQAY